MSYEIKCTRCKCVVSHTCDCDFREALIRLLSWVPEGGITAHLNVKALLTQIEPGIEEAPFFGSQAWSYTLFHKEEARTFHALINNVIRAAGLDPHSITMEARRDDDR